ncbi:MAG: HAMP domain-containing sensor histidine kinase, partial [Acidobacteriota bacterium]
DERYALIRRGTTWRNLLLALGPLLALAVAWRQSRPVLRFLETLSIAARRQARGDVQARLRVSSSSPDLDLAVATVNRMLGQLEQTVQGLSRVSDSIAHDLRTPLSRLQGQLDLLRQSSSASDEIIEAVQGEADQLLETFNALLRIAQVESGSRKRGFRRLDFVEIVRNVAELYAPVFAEKDILFTLDVPDTRVDYNGDRDLWLQALSNLVENALKYTPGGGTVHLALDAGAMRPLIRLVDSGPGIPEPERENVFRRFYRLQRHRGERGNGLGLSLVGAVCELHHAEIRLGGENGLTVEIEL